MQVVKFSIQESKNNKNYFLLIAETLEGKEFVIAGNPDHPQFVTPKEDCFDFMDKTKERLVNLSKRPLNSFHFSTRAYNCFEDGKIKSIIQLACMSEKELKQLRKMGAKTLKGIISILKEESLQLNMNFEKFGWDHENKQWK